MHKKIDIFVHNLISFSQLLFSPPKHKGEDL